MSEASTQAPEWFHRALANRPDSRWTSSAGARIHYLAWDRHSGTPGLVFVHGMLGHAHWWDFIAPFFVNRFRVFAVDLSGMGQSSHRSEYPGSVFVHDIDAVIRDARIAPAVVVGHSFGGSRLLEACAATPELIRGAVVLDSKFDGGSGRATQARDAKHHVFSDEAAALAHCCLLPEQACPAWSFNYVAKHSVQKTADGWCWRFDPGLRSAPMPANDNAILQTIAVSVDYIRGGDSKLVTAEQAEDIVAQLPNGRRPITVAGAGHHLMLDQPLALVEALTKTLSTYD